MIFHFGKFEPPEALLELYNFDQSVGSQYVDIEFIESADDALEILVPKYKHQFIVFAMSGTGSLMAFWIYKDFVSLDQAPIIYLDSEGGGNVVASSMNEFLSLLPYNTSFFPTAANHWMDYQESPDFIINPIQRYTEDFYKAHIDYLTNAYPCYEKFRTWLKNEMKIQIAENPYELIVKNVQSYPPLPLP